MPQKEQQARAMIDRLLEQAGWHLCDANEANIHSHRGVAVREFALQSGHGFADYLLYLDGTAAGIIEAKKEGHTLSGVETQADKYAQGLPAGLPAWRSPLPFAFQSTGAETRFTNGLDPQPRARSVFAFHRPEMLASWLYVAGLFSAHHTSTLGPGKLRVAELPAGYNATQGTFLGRLRQMPELATEGLWPAQIKAIRNLEHSLEENRPRALIQMATGSGKTFTSISFIYRLIKFAGARRVLFLVDRGNLGDQTLKEFQQYASPYNSFKFSEEYAVQGSANAASAGSARAAIVQRLSSNTLDITARVCICTIQRMYSMLRGKDFAQKITYRTTGTDIKPVEIVVFMRSVKSRSFFEQMKGRGMRVIGNDDLKAVTPDAVSKDHFVIVDAVGVCEQDKTDSRPMEKKPAVSFEKLLQAVSFGNTEEAVLTSIAGRLVRMEHRLREDEDNKIRELSGGLGVKELSRQPVKAVNPDRIVEAASRRLQQIESSNAELGYLNPYAPIEIAQANLPHWRQDGAIYFVTFRLADALPQDKLAQWREERRTWHGFHPKPWSEEEDREYYERFGKSIEKWLDQGQGSCILQLPEVNELVSRAIEYFEGERYRLGKFVVAANHVHVMVQPLPEHQLSEILHSWKSYTSKQISKVEAASRRLSQDHKRQDAASTVWQKEYYDRIVRTPEELYNIEQYIIRHREFDLGEWQKRRDAASTAIQEQVRKELAEEAVQPLHDPKLRELLVEVKKKNEITIDHGSQDEIIEAAFSNDASERARGIVQSFEQFIEEHKDEITALQILYSKPYKARLSFNDIKELADQIQAPPNLWTESQLWQAYAALEKNKVKGAGGRRILTDLVSLVRFAIHQDNELFPFPERVQANFKIWVEAASRRLKRQDGASTGFTDEQMHWLEMIRDHIAANLGIETDDFEYAPFAQEGGLGKVYQLFGDELSANIDELNENLAA
ncbi:MAG: DEAD/DEAH box helicase family protein [Gammaproteobacteria bacterium]|nr:DEAD/DEAH box helicase family protein [Gammaproteobacteria bacterium]